MAATQNICLEEAASGEVQPKGNYLPESAKIRDGGRTVRFFGYRRFIAAYSSILGSNEDGVDCSALVKT